MDDIVLTIRAFPIRVGGNSGPLSNEIDWQIVTEESDSYKPITEYTSVSKKLRRVARFDPSIVSEAILVNKPSRIALNHLDYVDSSGLLKRQISNKVQNFVTQVERFIENSIDFLGFGPGSIVENTPSLKVIIRNS